MESGQDGQPAVQRSKEPGSFRVVAWDAGELKLHAQSPTEGIGMRSATVSGGGESYTMSLSRGVPCAGSLELPPDMPDCSAGFSLRKTSGESLTLHGILTFTDGAAEFDWVGLQPGPYRGNLTSESGDPLEFQFELAHGGDQGLHVEVLRLTFEAMPVQVIEAGK